MTRFMMTLDDAVDLVLYAFQNGNAGDVFVQKSPAATIETLAKSLSTLMNKTKHPIDIIGTRHGEKLYETLLSREEMASVVDLEDYFRVPPDLRDLNYAKYFEEGELQLSVSDEYNSHNTARLDVDGMSELLMKLKFVEAAVRGEYLSPEI